MAEMLDAGSSSLQAGRPKPAPVGPVARGRIVLGTVVARFVGGLLMIAVLLRGCAGLRLRLSWLRLNREPVRRILRIGIPAASDGALMWTGHFFFSLSIM